MPLPSWIIDPALTGLIEFTSCLDAAQLAQVPATGPLILIGNHVNFLEIPVLYMRLRPRPVSVLTKVESFGSILNRLVFDLSIAIPVRRGEADLSAIRRCVDTLAAGRILAIAPEGTRSGTGRLQRSHPGVVTIALRSAAPMLPMAYWGHENVWRNIARLRRSDFHIAVGQPFKLDAKGVKVTQEVRQRMADEIMYQVAALMPPAYRGCYANLEQATEEFLCFSPPAFSNLRKDKA